MLLLLLSASSPSTVRVTVHILTSLRARERFLERKRESDTKRDERERERERETRNERGGAKQKRERASVRIGRGGPKQLPRHGGPSGWCTKKARFGRRMMMLPLGRSHACDLSGWSTELVFVRSGQFTVLNCVTARIYIVGFKKKTF
jgi:hypothetical protein